MRSPVPLLIRLYWGWEFFSPAKASSSIWTSRPNISPAWAFPWPHAQAILVGGTECLSGLLLLVGLAARLVSVPLMILLTVVFITADNETLRTIFSDPDKFTAAAPFLFFCAVVIVFVCGPGWFSLDAILAKYFRRDDR